MLPFWNGWKGRTRARGKRGERSSEGKRAIPIRRLFTSEVSGRRAATSSRDTRTLIEASLEYVPRELSELFVASTADEQVRVLRYALGELEQLVPLFLLLCSSMIMVVLVLRCLGGRRRVGGRLFSFCRQSLAFARTRPGGFEPRHGSLAAWWGLAAVSPKQGSESGSF